MAQVKSKNTKRKNIPAKSKNVDAVEKEMNIEIENDVIDDEPEVKVVNEKNEIIYDGEAEIKKVYDKLNYNENFELNETSKLAMDEIEKVSKIIENSSNIDGVTSMETFENSIESLSELEKKLEDEIKEISSKLTDGQKKVASKIDFTTFWSGISDGWNN